MILSKSGIELKPGNFGLDCEGNGTNGECCCKDCEYTKCCMAENFPEICEMCLDFYCAR